MYARKRDIVTVKNSDHSKECHQKRLILCNIREAYLEYKSTFSDDKIEFSKFAELWPKWCRTVSQSDFYVCVCTHHQNIKLMLSAVNSTFSYQVLLDMCVCDVTGNDCMFIKCEDCPASFENVVDFLRN